MISRYSRPEMAGVWSEERKLALWQEIEALVVEAWIEAGRAPGNAADQVRAAPPVDVEAWKERERVTNHDLAAFVDLLSAASGEGGAWVHYGLTSSDVVDTAQGVMMKEAGALLLDGIAALFATVKRRAEEHRGTLMIGRTHGIWAEPTTFGLKLAGWAFELHRDHERLSRAATAAAVGKLSGAVGTYAHVPPEVESFVCSRLGIAIEPASTQVTARDRHADFLSSIALTGAALERFATEIRHLQRSEVAEVREAFASGQKGSSAMPHKRNPIAAENVTGLARLLRAYAQTGLENVALWHERDISHSSVERVALPDACLLLDFALHRMNRLIDGLVVDTEAMRANLDASRGLVYSQAVLLALVEAGLTRDAAYRIVQRNAMAVWEGDGSLRDALEEDDDVTLDENTLARCFDPEHFLTNSSVVWERLAALSL